MTLGAAVWNRTNGAAVSSGNLVVTTAGETWSLISPRARRVLNEPGEGEVSVPLDHPNIAALNYRNVVRLTQDSEVIKSFVVREIRDVTASDDNSRLIRTASGEGLLGRLKEMVRVTPNPIDRKPLSFTRRHDWAAPETSAAGWTDTVYNMNRPDDVIFGEGFYRPIAWPTPVAPVEPLGIEWIHTVPSGSVHPAGVQYYHRQFTLASATEVALFVSASAQKFEAAIDGVVVLSEELLEPDGLWWWTWKAGVKLAAGTHTIRVKVDLDVSTGQGGMICSGWATGPNGITTHLFFTGDNQWLALNDPSTPPGQTPGQIIRLGMAEAAARGCETPTLNFSDTVDSNGDPWTTTVPLVYRVPTTELDVLDRLTPWVEFEIPDDTYRLDVYNVDTGVGSATGVEFGDITLSGVNGTA